MRTHTYSDRAGLLRRTALFSTCLIAAITCGSDKANGQITNGSFESGTTGWTFIGNVGVGSGEGKTDSINAAIFNGGGLSGTGSVSQTFTTIPGQRYKAQFDNGSFGASQPQNMTVTATGVGTLLSQALNVNGRGGSPGPTTWQRQNLLFTANSTATTLTFQDTTGSAAPSNDGNLDRVSVTPHSSVLNPGGAGTLGTINFISGQLSLNGSPNAAGLTPSATQNSLSSGGVASRAIDGNTNGSYGSNSITHTAGAVGDNWQVALGTLPGQPNAPNHTFAMSRIDLFNRIDCCSSRLTEFNVNVLAAGSPVDSNPFDLGTPNAGNVAGGVSGNTGAQDHDGTPGDDGLSIRLALNTVGDAVQVVQNFSAPLSLAEVQVFGLSSYTQNSADTLAIDILGLANNDFVNVAGNAVLDGTLEVLLPGAFPWTQGDTFDVLTASSITPLLNFTLDSSAGGGGWRYDIVAGGNGQILRLTALIPEPSTVALAALGLLSLTMIGWRRRSR